MWNPFLKYITQQHNKSINIIGLTYDEARMIHPNLRIVKIDDMDMQSILHKNICTDRCNVIIRDCLIIKIDGYY